MLIAIGIILILIILLLFIYAQRNIVLPKEMDVLMDSVIASPNPNVIFSELQYAKLEDTTICYEDTPSEDSNAEVVFLLHGLSQTMLKFPPFFCQKFLDAGFRLIRIDHQGEGGSDWVKNWGNPDKYTLEDMGRHAVQVADHLSIEKFHLIGMSMGGMIGQSMAIHYPRRIKSLTSIMSSSYMFDPKLPGVPPKFVLNVALCIIIYGLNLKSVKDKIKLSLAINRKLQGDDSYIYNHRTTIEAAHYEITHKKGQNSRSRQQHSYAIKKSGSRIRALQSLKIPTLVVHGKKDPLIKWLHAKKSVESIPNAKALYLDGMGHHLPHKFNAQITSAIIELIRRSSS